MNKMALCQREKGFSSCANHKEFDQFLERAKIRKPWHQIAQKEVYGGRDGLPSARVASYCLSCIHSPCFCTGLLIHCRVLHHLGLIIFHLNNKVFILPIAHQCVYTWEANHATCNCIL